MESKIVSMPTLRLACVRHIGRYPEIGGKFGLLFQHCAQHGISYNETLGLFHDDPGAVSPEKLRSDASVIVLGEQPLPAAAPDPSEGQVHGQEIPAGSFFTTTYVGSYSGLESHWGEFYKAFLAAGHNAASAPEFEIYKNDCSVTPESELITELYIPIAEAT